MDKSNPACYECAKSKDGLHTWKRNKDEIANCKHCNITLTKEQADDVWRE